MPSQTILHLNTPFISSKHSSNETLNISSNVAYGTGSNIPAIKGRVEKYNFLHSLNDISKFSLINIFLPSHAIFINIVFANQKQRYLQNICSVFSMQTAIKLYPLPSVLVRFNFGDWVQISAFTLPKYCFGSVCTRSPYQIESSEMRITFKKYSGVGGRLPKFLEATSSSVPNFSPTTSLRLFIKFYI